MAGSSPARLYCTVAGALLVIAGILGLFYSAGFDTGIRQVRRDTDELFGLFAVNGWDNLFHIALGFAGLACAANPWTARTFSLAVGLALVLYALWGLVFDDDGVFLGLVPVNDADNVVDLLAGLIGLGAGAATPAVARAPRSPRPTREQKPRERRRPRTERKPRAEREESGRRRERSERPRPERPAPDDA